jgi:hypothetical protein
VLLLLRLLLLPLFNTIGCSTEHKCCEFRTIRYEQPVRLTAVLDTHDAAYTTNRYERPVLLSAVMGPSVVACRPDCQ